MTETFRPELYWWIVTPCRQRFEGSKLDQHAFHELIFIERGRGCLQINRVKHNVRTGDLFILNPGDRHKLGTDFPKDFEIHYFAFHCAGPWRRIIDHALGQRMFPNMIRDAEPLLYDLLHGIQSEIDDRLVYHAPMTSLHIDMFLFGVLRLLQRKDQLTANKEVNSRDRRQLTSRIADLIKQNPHMHLSVDDMARHCYLSRSYFSKVFREETGESPARFVLQTRINRAKRLLLETDQKIIAIANSLGFEDEFHFSRVFKRLEGVSPSRYRNMICQ